MFLVTRSDSKRRCAIEPGGTRDVSSLTALGVYCSSHSQGRKLNTQTAVRAKLDSSVLPPKTGGWVTRLLSAGVVSFSTASGGTGRRSPGCFAKQDSMAAAMHRQCEFSPSIS